MVSMTGPTVARPGADGPEVHGPAEVRAALEDHATAETLALYDRQVEQATKQALEQDDVAPLARVLRHWWTSAQVARGELEPPTPSGNAMAKTIAAWEAKHPGQHLPRAA
jgi:hypothetical protein